MLNKSQEYLDFFCRQIKERPVGSPGNQAASARFQALAESFGWQVEAIPFSALDWESDGAECWSADGQYQVFPSPYSEGCDLIAELVAAASLEELQDLNCAGKLLLLHGELTREQLMPKNFVFYNPPEHQRIIAELERAEPAAILTATGRNPSIAGGIYPFPLIEDGDFQIPSAYLTAEEGRRLLPLIGEEIQLRSRARRIPGQAHQLIARRGQGLRRRIAITAHIDAKKGTPGAIDNGTGVVILLLLAELLQDYDGDYDLELIPFNGEDYYGASGQMIYLEANRDRWQEIYLNINIDGAGYHLGESAFSAFDLPSPVQQALDRVLREGEGLSPGIPWVQGDHSIFIQQGIPAIAISSAWFIDRIDSQDITHTARDHPGIVDHQKLVDISLAVNQLIRSELE